MDANSARPILPRRVFVLLVACVAAAALASPALAGRPSWIVKIQHITFSPSRLVLNRGESVTWQFLDAQLLTHHNVTSIGSSRFPNSHTMLTGTYTVRFNHPGTYRYMCTIHDFMHGTVVVR